MSEKMYTPYEVALEVLKKAQEVYNKHKEVKSDTNSDSNSNELKTDLLKSSEIDKCGEMSKEEDMSVDQAVEAIMGEKHGVNDIMSKLPKDKKSKVLAALRSKDAKKAEMCKNWMEKAEDEIDKCGEMKTVSKDESEKEPMKKMGSQGAPLGSSLGSSIAAGLSGGASSVRKEEKEDKLSEFLKKKKIKKAMGEGSKAVEAPKAPKAGSPQPPSISSDQGWSEKGK